MRRAFSLVELILVVCILGIIAALLLPAVQRVRSQADLVMCTSKLRTLGHALQGYHGSHGYYPSGCAVRPRVDPFLYAMWCLRVLPHLENEKLLDQARSAFRSDPFFLKVPPHGVGQTRIDAFVCPANPEQAYGTRQAHTHYLGVAGTNHMAYDGMLFLNSRVRGGEVSDGLSNTIMVGERPPAANGAYGWWYAGWGQDLGGSGEAILGVAELNAYKEPRVLKLPPGPFQFERWNGGIYTDILHFWSHHSNGGNFLFGDGSVRFLHYSASRVLPALATRAGKEPVTPTALSE